MSVSRNKPREFDPKLLETSINAAAVHRTAQHIASRHLPDKVARAAWLIRAVGMVDLTTLSGDDTTANVQRLCAKAKHPLSQAAVAALHERHQFLADKVMVGAVCVYPSQVATVSAALKRMGVLKQVHVAGVATGFPTGQYLQSTRLEEVRRAVSDGADEIDMVIPRQAALTGDFKAIYDDVRAVSDACGSEARLKVILATGELGSYANVYRASMASMMAGADYIKTSTGKESVNATLPVALVMMRAIRDYYQLTGVRIGFKPAGGLRTCNDALCYMALAADVLGEEWLVPSLFRIGASSLLGELEKEVTKFALGRAPSAQELTLS